MVGLDEACGVGGAPAALIAKTNNDNKINSLYVK